MYNYTLRAIWFPSLLFFLSLSGFTVCLMIGWWDVAILLLIFAVLSFIDVEGRYVDYQRLRRLNKFQRLHLMKRFSHSRCGREVMIAAHGNQASRYYRRHGYRWYHIFPDWGYWKQRRFS